MRVAHQWPIVAVAATVKGSCGSIDDVAIGLTNMGNTPMRARAAEDALRSGQGIDAAAQLADQDTNPPSDLNGEASYRRHLAKVLTRRAVTTAAGG